MELADNETQASETKRTKSLLGVMRLKYYKWSAVIFLSRIIQ